LTWAFACPDWEERLRNGRSLIPELPLDQKEARRAIAIYNKLRIPDVAGTPSFGEVGAEWFREIIAAIFGSYDLETGVRHVRESFNLVPKKNSKTTNGAALMVTALLMNRRPRAEFLLTGPTHEVSELAFNQAAGMIECDPDGFLQKRLHIQEHLKAITDRRTKARLKVKTFDASVATGPKPAGVLVDELHQIGKINKADKIIGQLRGGLISQPEGFLIFITTQSDDPPAGIFRDELMKARAIRDGRANGPMLPVLYEFPDEIIKSGAWRDPANWPMVTPNRDRSVTIARLIEDFEAAQIAGEKEVRRWASQHLNIEIGLALKSDDWAGAHHWEKNAEPALTLDELLARSEVATIGIDGGGLDDLLGLAVLGRAREPGNDTQSRKWLHWGHAWAHEAVLERRKDIAARLRDFEADGDLTIVKRVGDDVIEVADFVEQVRDSGLLPDKSAIGVDPVGIGAIVDELAERNIDASPEAGIIVGVPQGWKLNNAIKTAERKLAGGDLVHGGVPLMAWAVGNAKVEPRGNAITITKQAAGFAKIDPLMALLNAVALMAMNPHSGGIGEGIIILGSA
jgi:phage terminase large subunit-like protein